MLSQLSGFNMSEIMRRKYLLVSLVVLGFLLLEGVNGLTSHKMKRNFKSISHRYYSVTTPLPLSYAIDSTRMGIDIQATMPKNLTLPLILPDEEVLPSPITGTTTTRKNMLTKSWRKLKGAMKFDKQTIAKMGIDFGLTYNMISNINGSITLSAAWYISSMKTGLSPLAPGQWRSLLAAYASLYVVAALIRPFRIAIAIGATHKMEQLLQYMQKRIRCTRTNAIGMVFAFGIVLWLSCCVAGVTVASALAGVPLWKYS